MRSVLTILPIALTLLSAACTAVDDSDQDGQSGTGAASGSEALAALGERY